MGSCLLPLFKFFIEKYNAGFLIGIQIIAIKNMLVFLGKRLWSSTQRDMDAFNSQTTQRRVRQDTREEGIQRGGRLS